VPPTGGIDLCQRLKGNVRTHFVPTILCPLNDLRAYRVRALAAGADAIFSPSIDAQERQARLWALLRTRALFRRMDRKQRSQKLEIADRRQWLSHFLHDLKGQVAALSANVDFLGKFGPAPTDPRRADFEESVKDARGIFEQLKANLRTVLDFDRFETGQLVAIEGRFLLSEAAGDVLQALRGYAALSEKTLSFVEPAGAERTLYGDRELVACAILNLGMGALRRAPARSRVQMEIAETDTGMRFRVVTPGAPLAPAERLNMFEPYARHPAGAVAYGLGLALARAVVQLQEGRVWAEDLAEGGCAFVFELGWKRSGPRPRRAGSPSDHASGKGPA
jgi:K+-sensing histidine kinase KdpD